MLPLSHTYISTKTTGRHSPLLILGSILPDISTTSAQQIGREQIHNSPRAFADFIGQYFPTLKDLGLGVRLHSQVDGGADFYSDDLKVGYAKLEGMKIATEVASLLEIPNGDISLVLAHNFIEMAVDLHLYQNQREIWDIYNSELGNVKTEIPQIAKCMADYLHLEEPIITKEIFNLIDFLQPNNLISKEVAVERVALPLIRLRFNKEVSRDKTLKIAEEALNITKPTYISYLDSAVIEVKRNILGL